MTSSIYFHDRALSNVLPFNRENNLLEPTVQSDHAEIMLTLPLPDAGIVNSWNVSNAHYHNKLDLSSNNKPPFLNTHLYVAQPFVGGKMDNSLRRKTSDQIRVIAERFVAGKVGIQVIVEGYQAFYPELAKKIEGMGKTDFKIVSLLDYKTEWEAKWNVTGLLIDTSRFTVLSSGVLTSKYQEEGSKEEKEQYLPYVHVSNKISEADFVLLGVHIAGCASQYPKVGLETLAAKMKEIQGKCGNCDVIAMGDFNSTPKNVNKSVIKAFEGKGSLLNPPYPTHVNTQSQAGNYDLVAILRGEPSNEYMLLPREHLSPASQALIRSIESSRKKYLDSKL